MRQDQVPPDGLVILVAKVPARATIQMVCALVLLTLALLPSIPTVGRLLLAGVAIVLLAVGWKRVVMARKHQARVSRSGIQVQDPEKSLYMSWEKLVHVRVTANWLEVGTEDCNYIVWEHAHPRSRVELAATVMALLSKNEGPHSLPAIDGFAGSYLCPVRPDRRNRITLGRD